MGILKIALSNNECSNYATHKLQVQAGKWSQLIHWRILLEKTLLENTMEETKQNLESL